MMMRSDDRALTCCWGAEALGGWDRDPAVLTAGAGGPAGTSELDMPLATQYEFSTRTV